jgi:hypothetical protein
VVAKHYELAQKNNQFLLAVLNFALGIGAEIPKLAAFADFGLE